MDRIIPFVAALWAGALLGGSFIAAPAKFTVEALALPELLAVGQAQFQALAVAELLLAIVLVGVAIWRRPVRWWLVLVPVIIFAEQQLMIYPALDARTEARIAGQAVGESHLHLIYVALEGVKFLSLVALAFYLGRGRPA
ncbi:MAG: hypothetical protein AAGI10_10740 [Pseudomonadota bacterium]